MSNETTSLPNMPRKLSTAAPILRVPDKRIISGMRMVPMDQVVTPIPGQTYTGLDGKPVKFEAGPGKPADKIIDPTPAPAPAPAPKSTPAPAPVTPPAPTPAK